MFSHILECSWIICWTLYGQYWTLFKNCTRTVIECSGTVQQHFAGELSQFSKKISLAKNGGHFEFFAKIAKHKNAYISKTVLDRAISTKFLRRRVYLQSSHANFQKNFVSPKMAAILNFEFFAKIAKHRNAYISKTLLERAISTKL